MKEKKKYVHHLYNCPWCKDDKMHKGSTVLRVHVRKYHPEITEVEMEYYIAKSRYPNLDELVQRYIDRLETLMTLLDKGYNFKKYLDALGVRRHWLVDLSIQGLHKHNPGLKTAEDVRAAYERQLIGNFREASPEKRFQAYLNRDNSVLDKKGQTDLIGPISTLKTIKFVKERLQETMSENPAPEEKEPENV